MFGEYVTAIRFEHMIKEIILKASLYNWFQSIIVIRLSSYIRINNDYLNELHNRAHNKALIAITNLPLDYAIYGGIFLK